MGEKNCCTCRVGKYKRALCDESFCEKYHGDGDAEDFIKMVTQGRKTGHWILDRSGAYCCSKCMEPCAGYVMMKPRDKFCKMCGSRNEVQE